MDKRVNYNLILKSLTGAEDKRRSKVKNKKQNTGGLVGGIICLVKGAVNYVLVFINNADSKQLTH